ncbi:SUMF1/EgtB/PvdO family nonheme iron enzyme [Calditrichota bacterium LG25]
MNRRIVVVFFTMALFILTGIWACEKKPTAPQRDNPFDPKNVRYDNIPPKIILNVNPDSGITNETLFVFDASRSFENDEKDFNLASQWDLNGDGNYDEKLKQNNLIKKIKYETGGGSKKIKLRIQGAKGLTVDTSFSIFVNTRPQAAFTATRDNNNYKLYHFDASASNDYEDGHNLQYLWDFDGDGAFDTAWLTQDTIRHQFGQDGKFTTYLSVRDRNGLSTNVFQEITVKPPVVEMVYVPGGTFTMGDTWGDGDSDERPTHSVTVNSFYMGKYEVTQAQYQEIMGNNPSYFQGDNRPVEQVIWYDAVEFCNKLSEREGLEPCYTINGTDVTCDFTKNGYRLPTEAEWEYAAKGGANGNDTKYSGSDNVDDVAWYAGNSGGHTHEVGTKQPNELGLYDMSGNVWEWCWDWYASDYYSNSPQDNPKGPDSGTYRVLRGGSWNGIAIYVRVALRSYNYPNGTNNGIGFRILRTQ